MTFFSRKTRAALLLAASYSMLACAEVEDHVAKFSLHGFGTLGAARSSSNDAEFIRDMSQPSGIKGGQWSGRIDNIFGLQASWQATPELEVVGQVVSRLRFDHSRDAELMWAFAKWEPNADSAIRFGRIGADFMMLADSRLVGYSYLTVRPSVDFFGPLFFSHFDGGDASLTVPFADGLLRTKVFAGATREKTSGAPGIWDTSGSPVSGFVVDYMRGPWLLRFNTAEIRFSSDIKFAPLPETLRSAGAPAAADALGTKGKTAHFYSLGFVYDAAPLMVQGMVNAIDQETPVFQDSHAAYLLAGYRVGSVTPYVGVSRWKTRRTALSTGLPSPAFDTVNASFDAIMAASVADQVTTTLGGRWDFQTNMALKAQWDSIRGEASSRFPFARTAPGWNGKTDVFSVVVDFVF